MNVGNVFNWLTEAAHLVFRFNFSLPYCPSDPVQTSSSHNVTDYFITHTTLGSSYQCLS
jgi:hypothetical protein